MDGGGKRRSLMYVEVELKYLDMLPFLCYPACHGSNLSSPGQFFLGNDVRETMYARMICPPPGWIVPLERVSGVSLVLISTLSCVLRIIFIVLVIVTLKATAVS